MEKSVGILWTRYAHIAEKCFERFDLAIIVPVGTPLKNARRMLAWVRSIVG